MQKMRSQTGTKSTAFFLPRGSELVQMTALGLLKEIYFFLRPDFFAVYSYDILLRVDKGRQGVYRLAVYLNDPVEY